MNIFNVYCCLYLIFLKISRFTIIAHEYKSADFLNMVKTTHSICFYKNEHGLPVNTYDLNYPVKMVRCTVTSCRKCRRKNPGIVLYALPDGAATDPVWLSVLKYGRPTRWIPKRSTRICSDHFKQCDKDGRKLLPRAIPSREPVVFHPLITGKT